jgi:hypothetical protein
MKAYYSASYLLIWCVGLTAIGVPLIQYAHRHSHH